MARPRRVRVSRHRRSATVAPPSPAARGTCRGKGSQQPPSRRVSPPRRCRRHRRGRPPHPRSRASTARPEAAGRPPVMPRRCARATPHPEKATASARRRVKPATGLPGLSARLGRRGRRGHQQRPRRRRPRTALPTGRAALKAARWRTTAQRCAEWRPQGIRRRAAARRYLHNPCMRSWNLPPLLLLLLLLLLLPLPSWPGGVGTRLRPGAPGCKPPAWPAPSSGVGCCQRLRQCFDRPGR
mmetsp:Transcript_66902/g.217618  ORF Transcript_66902/g.217618 Transcript_66902/m.217618 type:complete len:241 (+) Transcript_66902:1376-2098(+)